MRLDHIGYAVENIDRYWTDIVQPLLCPVGIGPVFDDPVQDVRIAFVTLASGERIELIEPRSDSSPVSKILRARRGGIYHLCFETDRFAKAIERFQSQRCILLAPPAPAVAFDGRLIAFFYTPTHDLFELVEAESTV